MQNSIEHLMALQKLQLETSERTPHRAEKIAALRTEIPESLLRTFDRFIAREKKPVSIVRNGVCSECHLRIAVGTLAALAFAQEVQQCGNCVRFLYLPADESVYPPVSATTSKGVRSRKTKTAPITSSSH